MKVVILAGGFGTRISEYTHSIPKPMITVGNRPILWHIMNRYAKYGYNDFYIALGYKAEVIKDYFLNYYSMNSDFTVDLSQGSVEYINKAKINWKVTLVDTGIDSLTATRLKLIMPYIGNEQFMFTYGDGVADIDLSSLYNFHIDNGKVVTMTAVRPSARFGDLVFDGSTVKSFEEKPQLHEGWINGGFFICEPKLFDYLSDENQMFEREPLTKIVSDGQLSAYKHNGFWQCMDTQRDHEQLEKLWKSNKPWL